MNCNLQVYDFALKEAAHLLLPNSSDEKEPQRKKKKKNRLVGSIVSSRLKLAFIYTRSVVVNLGEYNMLHPASRLCPDLL